MGHKFKNPKQSAFKLWVSFKDGGRANLASRDWKHKKYAPHEGLFFLERYVLKNSDKIKTAIIYDKRAKEQMIRKFSSGSWKYYAKVFFT